MNLLLFFDKTVLMKRILRCKDAKTQRRKALKKLCLYASMPLCIFFLFTLYSLLFTQSVSAEENWGVLPQSSVKQGAGEASQKVWDNEENEKIDEYYGSEESPDFLNREGIDPATSEYDAQYDYEDDEPYNYEAGGS